MWVISLLEQITGFLPRPLVVTPDEGGYRQFPKPWSGWPWNYVPEKGHRWKIWRWFMRTSTGSCWVTEMLPGEWYWILPWFSEHSTCKTRTQTKDIRAQSVWTKDGHNLTLGASVRYYIQKPMKALLDVQDYDDTLQNIVLGVICEFVEDKTLDQLRGSLKDLRQQLLSVVKKETSGWGLFIQAVSITDVGEAVNHRLLISGKLDGIQGQIL